MLTKELLAKVRFIEINTSRLVNTIFAGEYHSVFKGRGMEFEEVREYDVQDDIRDIDWNVTARMGAPYTKKFIEERELTVMFLVDLSSSGRYGTRGKSKSEVIAEICALLAFSAIKNNDRVGLIIFTDEVEKFIPPKKGRLHVLRVVREILSFTPRRQKTDLNCALKLLNDVVTKRSTVFLISDFITSGYEKLLKISHKKHDVTALVVEDVSEKTFPAIGMPVDLEDAETGEVFSLAGSAGFRRRFHNVWESRKQEREKTFTGMGLDFINLEAGVSYIDALIRFFKNRARRINR